MIYQFFYKNDFDTKCFNHNYVKYDLSILTDSTYLPSIQSEYCGMIYAWYDTNNINDWIGFTSCRQINKGFYKTVDLNNAEISDVLQNYDIITWGWLCNNDKRFASSKAITSLFDQAEFFHRGIMTLMNVALIHFNEKLLLDLFMNNSCGIFCNYWLMSKNNFNEFMSWSFPIVQWMVNNPKLYDTNGGHYNIVGFIIERMFIYWYLSRNKTVHIC
jgi:hypothetical protein